MLKRRSETRSLRGLKLLRILITEFAQLTRYSLISIIRSLNSIARKIVKSI
jgi:hypothetical protein